MNREERRQFVYEHRTCVFGYARHSHGPAMTIVYYVVEGDELLISTMAGRSKPKAIDRDGRMSLCVLDEHWPVTYLQVYGNAVVDRDPDLAADVLVRVIGLMANGNMIVEAGGLRMAGNPIKFSAFDDPPTRRPAPELGADGERIRGELLE